MGLCLADSLLLLGRIDGADIRTRFWNWWNNGLNNAFRLDPERATESFGRMCIEGGGSLSVGLGGNIANSLDDVGAHAQRGTPLPPRFESLSEDAGNGSLMRLAPAALLHHAAPAAARAAAAESSLTTHPGSIAAEACAFLAHLLTRLLHRKRGEEKGGGSAAAFLERAAVEYAIVLDERDAACSPGQGGSGAEARVKLRRLLRASEPDDSTERCWNWRAPRGGLGLAATLAARGREYNGYPVSAGYFGAFSLDGLAMALHCVHATASFGECVAACVNLCGDADTTGAIAGQVAGAYYGFSAIDPEWVRRLRQWDGREVELRAVALYVLGCSPPSEI